MVGAVMLSDVLLRELDLSLVFLLLVANAIVGFGREKEASKPIDELQRRRSGGYQSSRVSGRPEQPPAEGFESSAW